MAKSRLPWGPRPRKPGVGLGHIIPDTFREDEGPTHKMPVIDTDEERVRCPRCSGSSMVQFKNVERPDDTPDPHEFGIYQSESCPSCSDGRVTPAEADTIRAEMKTAKT